MSAEREPSQLPIASLIAVMLALGGIWLGQSPLKSSRPDNGVKSTFESSQARITARLWQDPFAVLEEHAKRLEKIKDPLALKELEDKIHIREDHFGNIDDATVLLVMLEKNPYAEDVEQRLRVRYTVGIALNSAGFTPYDSTSIGYFAVGQTLAAYELYENVHKDESGYSVQNVLVVWMPESDIQTIIHVGQELRKALPGANLKLLGPRTTTTLFGMHVDAACSRDYDWGYLDGMELFSYRATTDSRVFRFVSMNQAEIGCKALQQFPTPEASLAHRGIHFLRTVGSDAALADELLDELENRGLDGLTPDGSYNPAVCKPSMDRIALISEADTYYGRVLPVTFAASLFVKKGYATDFQNALVQIENDPQSWPCSIVAYTYLNGLDGEVPGAHVKDKKQSEDTQVERGETPLPNHKTAKRERSEGPSQLDYAVRLADKIKSDNDRNLQNGQPTFRAIGILGSDVYDKLLLLQALRKRLPNAIFFTTDLDARLWHQSEFAWTRNLLVASHYDVQLSNQWGQELHVSIAPFRDGYQTALYLSTLQAVGWLREDNHTDCLLLTDSKQTFSRDRAPKLYEIGRKGPVDISVHTKPACRRSDVLPINPDRPNVAPRAMTFAGHRFGFTSVVMMLSLAFGSILTLMVPPLWVQIDRLSSRIRSWTKPRKVFEILAAAIAVVVTSYVVLEFMRYVLVLDGNRGEPFSVTDSVSVWPTEVIRLIGIALAISFFIKGASELRLNREAIKGKYLTAPEKKPSISSQGRTEGHVETVPRSDWMASILGLLKQIKSWPSQLKTWPSVDRWINTRLAPTRQGSVDALAIWNNYLRSGQPFYAVCRIGLIFLAYVIFGLLLFQQVEMPLRPCRGTVSCAADIGLLVLTIFFSVLLSLWVFDLARRCIALIDHLTADSTVWNSNVLDNYEATLKAPRKVLTDWLKIHFIADRTRVVGGTVVYPFIVFVVVLSARNRYFDNWDFPVPLIVVLTLNAVLILTTAILLKRAAERARGIAIDHMNELLLAEKGQGKDHAGHVEQLALMVEEVKKIRRGAFNNIFQQPAVSATLLGALALLQYFLPL